MQAYIVTRFRLGAHYIQIFSLQYTWKKGQGILEKGSFLQVYHLINWELELDLMILILKNDTVMTYLQTKIELSASTYSNIVM